MKGWENLLPRDNEFRSERIPRSDSTELVEVLLRC
jgi:hypothetical protein